MIHGQRFPGVRRPSVRAVWVLEGVERTSKTAGRALEVADRPSKGEEEGEGGGKK